MSSVAELRAELSALAKRFGVSQQHISKIKHGRRWAHSKGAA